MAELGPVVGVDRMMQRLAFGVAIGNARAHVVLKAVTPDTPLGAGIARAFGEAVWTMATDNMGLAPGVREVGRG